MALDVTKYKATAESFKSLKIAIETIPALTSKGMWEAYVGTITVIAQKFENVKMSMYDLLGEIKECDELTPEEKTKYESQINGLINDMISKISAKSKEFEAAAEKFGFLTREKQIKPRDLVGAGTRDVAEIKTTEDPRLQALHAAVRDASHTFTDDWMNIPES